MIQLERSMNHKWIIDKNVNSKDILSEFAAILSASQNGFQFEDVVSRAISQGRKREGDYADKGSTITIGVRLLQACFYMFGYSKNVEGGKKLFMPSPTTLNILATDDPDEQAKNYLVNLFGMQYPHPYDWTPSCFNLYFGRLILKLLLDDRIGSKLYIDECLWFLPFIERVDNDIYEELISSIIEYRGLSYDQKHDLFFGVEDGENLFANVAHEINYYLLRLFHDFGVFELVEDSSHNEGKLFRFLHSATKNTKTYRNDAYGSRGKRSGYVRLSSELIEHATLLLREFSPFERPTQMDDEDIFSKEDWLTNIYQTEPLQYLACINSTTDRNSEVTNIVNEMIHASKYGSRDGKEFEMALKPFIELFRETINVEILSGAGNTDLLCAMEELPSERLYNMNLEAKTRGNALEGVQTSRINNHLRKHGSEFCMIVAPRFAKGVNGDIENNSIVTIRSEEFGNYCFKECIHNPSGLADFSSILEIIHANLGKDITGKVRALTEARYGIAVG